MWKSLNIIILDTSAKTRKRILTYKKYIHDLGQNDSNLLVDHTYVEIVIVFTIDLYLFKCHNEMTLVMQLAKYSPE